MKNKLALLFFLIICHQALCQTKIDELVSVTFPSNPKKLDTVVENMTLTSYVFTSQKQNFQLQRIVFKNDNDTSNYPNDTKGLQEFYKKTISESVEKIKPNGFILRDSLSSFIGNYVIYKVRFYSIKTKKDVCEMVYLYLNKNLYTINYFSVNNFDEKIKNNFFATIKINSQKKPLQYKNLVSNPKKLGYVVGKLFMYIVFVSLFIFVLAKFRKKTLLPK